ncbi:MAG TPA: MarR family winged helix-turn-helix transcriptional regulator [Solirubrobacteraceae bacterium]|jgi:DNA-binding MarR family transcriptional regulator|nr:MarR family winged helix-turn-helix transcriptional regulator [Solirubrobacteraceae bacterium]
MPEKSTPNHTACSYRTDDDGLAHWTEAHADAWIGLLETHKQLTRALDAELSAQHGLSLSGLELLARLAAADGRQMHLSALAGASGLSLSRVSRIIGVLDERRLVDRHSCPSDARAVHARITDEGLALVRCAQSTHFASVQAAFFDQLEEDEIATLARVFGRFAPRAKGTCDAG